MKTDLIDIQLALQIAFKKHIPPLKISKENEDVFEVTGTKEAMQGKKLVNGYYFGSVVPKPRDIRLYYFPIYTHVKKFDWLSDEARKCLKGKSCFHIKKLSPELESELRKMIDLGIEIYSKADLI